MSTATEAAPARKTTPQKPGHAAPGPAELRALALVCIRCSGGACDANGAYTLCALCELDALAA